MWDWLASPIDASRAHEVGFAISWHARAMILGWGILAPLAVIVARFFKIMPGQDWPKDLDNPSWWRSHWIGQSLVIVLSLFAIVLVMPADFSQMTLHRWLGYAVLLGVAVQTALGVFRGSKGGPTSPASDGSFRGDHYDMTNWRRTFEMLHKTLGYGLLFLASVTILVGLWDANGPRWMWGLILLWWSVLIVLFFIFQRRGMAVDTYQAIWGDNLSHPGNKRTNLGWGMNRPGRPQATDEVPIDNSLDQQVTRSDP